MECVRAALDDHIDDAAGFASVLGGEVAGLNAELLQSVRIRRRHRDIGPVVVVVAAIEDVVGSVARGAAEREEADALRHVGVVEKGAPGDLDAGLE